MSGAARRFGIIPRSTVLAALTLASTVYPFAAAAQVVPAGGTPPALAGTINNGLPTAQEVRRQPDTPPPPPAAARVRARGALAPGPCPEAIAGSTLSAPLTGVDFSGPGGADLDHGLRAALAGVGHLDGSARPIRAICEVRDAANAALARAHYVATIRVPEQTIAGGHLKLEVITAHIVALRVRGDPGRSAKRIEALLDRLKQLDPFNEIDAERILLLAGDIPGVSVTLELQPAPSGKLGEVVGEIAVDRVPAAVFVNAQNYGSTQIGRYSGLLRGELYGLTGLADRTFLGVFTTGDFREQQVVQFGHDFALTSSGLRVGGEFTYAWTRPTIATGGVPLDLRSRSLLGTLSAALPVVRQSNHNLRLDGGFDFIEQRTRASGTPINTDKLREIYLQLDGDAVARSPAGLAPAWRLAGGVEARKGVNILGTTRVGQTSGGAIPTRFEGDPQAVIVRANALAEGRLRFGPVSPFAVTVSVDGRGQWANHPLLAFDELAVGNLTIGRGYDPGATSGDRAIGAASEVRIGKPQPLSRKDWAYEAVAFYDVIHIRNLDSNLFEANRTLHSYGGGVRATWGSHGRIDVFYAKPKDRALAIDTKLPPGRLLVSLTIRAFPWH